MVDILDGQGYPLQAPPTAQPVSVSGGYVVSPGDYIEYPEEIPAELANQTVYVFQGEDGNTYYHTGDPQDVTWWVKNADGQYVPAPMPKTPDQVAGWYDENQRRQQHNTIVGANLLGAAANDMLHAGFDKNNKMIGAPGGPSQTLFVDPETGKIVSKSDITGSNASTTGTGGYSGGGGYGTGGYSSGSYGNGYYNGPRVAYANGYVPMMFGGNYTYQEWLRMQYPPDNNSGPAPLPELPWKNNFELNVFGDQGAPGNPFEGSPDWAPRGGWNNAGNSGGYNSSGDLPLARQLYQKYAGKFGQAAGTDADYEAQRRQQNADYRKSNRDFTDYQNALAMRQNPIWGLRDYLGSQSAYEGPEYDLYNSMPLQGLQYLLNAKANASKFDSPDKYQKQLQKMYKEIDKSNEEWNYDQLMKSMWSGGKNSVMTSLFQNRPQPEAKYDSAGNYTGMQADKPSWANPMQQMGSMNTLLSSVYGMTMDPNSAATWAEYADRQMAEWANKQYRRNPNNYADIRKYMKRRVV